MPNDRNCKTANGDVIYFCVREETRSDISDLESVFQVVSAATNPSSRAVHFIGIKVSRIIECSMLSMCLEDIGEKKNIYIYRREREYTIAS